MTMKKFFNKYKIMIIGAIIGVVAGYLYWYFIGCNSGSCPLTSSPVNTSVSGGLLGGLLFSSFEKEKKNDK